MEPLRRDPTLTHDCRLICFDTNTRKPFHVLFFFKQKTAYEIGLGIPAEPLFRSKLFRIRMSRNFGMKMLTMTNLSTECLIQLTKLGYDATPFNQILKQNAKREMRLRLG